MKPYAGLIVTTLILLLLPGCRNDNETRTLAEIKTTKGDIVIALSDLTPLHRDNFISLAESGFYDGVLFHRIIKDFMIQTGDGATKSSPSSIDDYRIPAEINDSLFHLRGVVAAAREGDDVNPDRMSSGTQFYIVQGKKYSDEELDKVSQRIDYNKKQFLYYRFLKEARVASANDSVPLSEDEIQQAAVQKMLNYTETSGSYVMPSHRRDLYKTTGGTPFLDGAYTVFGEVLKGMDVVDAIASSATDSSDRPHEDIRIVNVRIIRNK